jgi:hypothetical protein
VWNSPDYSNATEIAQSGDRRGETVSAQTVSKVTRDLDETLREFHQARWSDLILTDGCAGLAAAIRTVYPGAASTLLGAQDAQSFQRKRGSATTTK